MKLLFKKIFTNLKLKFLMNVFNLFDAFEEQFGKWYYFEINIQTIDGKNDYQLPVICCMKEESHAKSLLTQIIRDLAAHFNISATSLTQISKQQKTAKIKELENLFASKEINELQALIYKVTAEKNRPLIVQDFSEEDLNPTNLDSFKTYKQDKVVSLRLNSLKNQGVPFNQIRDCFLVKIDKSKLE